MDNVLARIFKKLQNSNNRLRYDPLSMDIKRIIIKRRRYLDRLMNHLQNMMLGYENEEVQGLVKKRKKTARRISSTSFDIWMDTMLEITEKLCNIRYGSSAEGENIVVGFDDEVKALLDQLTQTSIKQLQVISIAGMAGLGKTTLVKKLYGDPLTEYYFDVRAWTCVSQTYVKRDLLLGILSSFMYDFTEEIYNMSDEQLGEKLYRRLKDRRYLVVLDDIWDCVAWNDLKIYFPDDKVGSRVMFTSRDMELSLHVRAARPAHVLRLRTTNESWDIFQKKLFISGICPSYLKRIGRLIVEKCEGLPLAIVIAAGLVKNQLSVRWWSQIASSLRSFMVRDPSQYMDTLSLSYNHLPPPLRSCFLFVGVFPEDYDIPVTKLICLWIAQGFIHQTGSRTLEDIAEDFLMELIRRSMLMIAKQRADGKIKTCRIHDLLRDLCLRKAKENNVSPQTYRYAPCPASSSNIRDTLHRMSVHIPPSHTFTGLCYPFEFPSALLADGSLLSETYESDIILDMESVPVSLFPFESDSSLQVDGSVLSQTYESLRILDMESVPISIFPSGVTELSNLRYLAIQARDGSPQASISNLINLQVLIILSRKNIVVPKTVWDMVYLRHLYIKAGVNLIEEPSFVQLTENEGCPSGLVSLQTLSQVSPQSCHNIFSRTPNLRKLGFCGPLISRVGNLECPNIRSLEHLQKLKLLNTIPCSEWTRSWDPLAFPEKLKKLTLSNTCLGWEEMWAFTWLPNLEVLSLKVHAFIGEKWETSDVVFRRLKVLKLCDLDLRKWISLSDSFQRLQRLVVRRCLNLESIPSGLGKILTLDMIEVSGCSSSAHSSALEIQKEQELEGNYFLKVHASNNC